MGNVIINLNGDSCVGGAARPVTGICSEHWARAYTGFPAAVQAHPLPQFAVSALRRLTEAGSGGMRHDVAANGLHGWSCKHGCTIQVGRNHLRSILQPQQCVALCAQERNPLW